MNFLFNSEGFQRSKCSGKWLVPLSRSETGVLFFDWHIVDGNQCSYQGINYLFMIIVSIKMPSGIRQHKRNQLLGRITNAGGRVLLNSNSVFILKRDPELTKHCPGIQTPPPPKKKLWEFFNQLLKNQLKVEPSHDLLMVSVENHRLIILTLMRLSIFFLVLYLISFYVKRIQLYIPKPLFFVIMKSSIFLLAFLSAFYYHSESSKQYCDIRGCINWLVMSVEIDIDVFMCCVKAPQIFYH